jgi:hypothetical protein
MRERAIRNAYLKELFGSLAVYMVVLFAAIHWGKPMPEGWLRTVVLLSPMIGFLLMIWAIARHIGRIDEYMRQLILETLSISAAITAAITFSYGFLETAGYPKISMFTVWTIMGASWAVVCGVRWLLNRRHSHE